MPVLPSSLLDPLWDQFATHLPTRPEFDPTHPLGCHRRRIPDRVVFELVIAALVHGSGLERIAVPGCSDRSIRRRLHAWADAGIGQEVFTATLAAYDTMIGLDLEDVSVDGSITKAVGGGECAGRSPVDPGKGGTKRSVLVEARGVPLHVEVAGANCHDSPLLAPTLAGLNMLGPLPERVVVHLDAYILQTWPGTGVDEFLLERREERLRDRVVVADPSPPQRTTDTVPGAESLELFRRVLLEFNWSMQHRVVGGSIVAHRRLRQGSATPRPCGVAC